VDPHLTRFLGPIQAHSPNGISIGSAVFAQMTAVSLYFTMGRPIPPQNCPFPWGTWTPSNTRFLGPTESSIQRHLDRFGRLCGAHYCDRPTNRQTDRSTDHATLSVTIGRIYLCNTVMRPNNNTNHDNSLCNVTHKNVCMSAIVKSPRSTVRRS